MTECSRCGMPAQPGEQVCRTCGATLAPDPSPAQDAMSPAPQDVAPSAPRAADMLPTAPGAVGEQSTSAEASTPGTATAGVPKAPAASGPVPSIQTPRLARQGTPPAMPPAAPTPPSATPYQAAPYVPHAPYAAYPYAYPPYPQASPNQVPLMPGQPAAGYPPAYYPGYYPGYPAYYPGYYYMPPRRAPGETYRLVLAWIVTIGSGLTAGLGLLLLVILLIEAAAGERDNLTLLGGGSAFVIAALGGGAAGVYFGITALLKRPSLRFELPPWWIFLGLTALALAGEVLIWNLAATPGSALVVLPLIVLSGLLPALTILTFTSQRLRSPSTWRHVFVSAVHGATLAIVVGAILELIAQVVMVAIAQALGYHVSNSFSPTNINPSNGTEVVLVLLLISVVAPLVEEGVKPIGALLLMPRLRSPAEAFVVGMAAGMGFDFVETLGYISMGQADWITVAIERVGAGLVHGVGAGMATLGWYYLIRGKGVPRRWLRGVGGLVYAVLQHAIFNASNLLGAIPPIGHLLSQPIYLGKLPLAGDVILALVLYGLVVVVLVVVTGRLRAAPTRQQPAMPQSPPPPGAGSQANRMPEPVQGGAR